MTTTCFPRKNNLKTFGYQGHSKKMKTDSFLPLFASWLLWLLKAIWLKPLHIRQQEMVTSLLPKQPLNYTTGTLNLEINCPPHQRGERTVTMCLWATNKLCCVSKAGLLCLTSSTDFLIFQQRKPSQLLSSTTKHLQSWKLWAFCGANLFIAGESLWPPTVYWNAQTSQEALHKQLGTMRCDAAVFLHDKFITIWPWLMLMYSEKERERLFTVTLIPFYLIKNSIRLKIQTLWVIIQRFPLCAS